MISISEMCDRHTIGTPPASTYRNGISVAIPLVSGLLMKAQEADTWDLDSGFQDLDRSLHNQLADYSF